MAAVCLLFSIVPPPGLAHRLILFLSWPGTHSTLHSMAPSSSFALVLIFIMVKGRGEYWTHCSAIHPWVPCISFPRGLALGGPLGPNTVRPPNLQYPQRLPLTLDRRGSPAVCLDSSNRLFICRATSPPPPPANRIRPTTVLIWILYFASGMVNQEGRPTQHPVLLSPFAKPYLFHVLFFFFFLLSLPSLPLPLPLPPPPSAHRAFLPSPVSLSAASGLFLLFSSFPTKASARVGILSLL